MNKISIDPLMQSKCPDLRLACLRAKVQVQAKVAGLWEQIAETIQERQNSLGDTSVISQLPAIQETRKGYKSCGKDPARYRPSAESLLRRILQGKGLYQVNNIVDLLNLVSIRSGFSIGGYDADKIEGDISLGIGRANEAYQGIGRGDLNIEFLPVLRDQLGAFGSPTSDSTRTMVNEATVHFLMVFFAFGKEADLETAVEDAANLLKVFGGGEDIAVNVVSG